MRVRSPYRLPLITAKSRQEVIALLDGKAKVDGRGAVWHPLDSSDVEARIVRRANDLLQEGDRRLDADQFLRLIGLFTLSNFLRQEGEHE